ncbi:hypothetical protein [Neisseria iguanae]|uniref:hypothetical protein n=1 Tax=Neisseria iguanae TaxID=90242 RepID=UPI0014757D62|nr:hypothetical protein [Neisseria iguanae]
MLGLIIFVIAVCFVCMFLVVEMAGHQPNRHRKSRQNSNKKKQSNLNREEKTALKGAIGEQIIKVQVLSKLDATRTVECLKKTPPVFHTGSHRPCSR